MPESPYSVHAVASICGPISMLGPFGLGIDIAVLEDWSCIAAERSESECSDKCQVVLGKSGDHLGVGIMSLIA